MLSSFYIPETRPWGGARFSYIQGALPPHTPLLVCHGGDEVFGGEDGHGIVRGVVAEKGLVAGDEIVAAGVVGAGVLGVVLQVSGVMLRGPAEVQPVYGRYLHERAQAAKNILEDGIFHPSLPGRVSRIQDTLGGNLRLEKACLRSRNHLLGQVMPGSGFQEDVQQDICVYGNFYFISHKHYFPRI